MFLKKQIFQLNVLKKLLSEEHSCVTLIPTTRMLALPPCFLNDIKKGIFFMLNKALKKYDQHLDGILIGYQNVKILMDDRTGLIPMGVADIRVNVSIEFYVFQPKIGGLLKGVVNKKSSSHIGCLVHKYFNASILKPDDIEFEDWDCKDINVDDQIEFRVSDLDFTGFMPIIEGVLNKSDSSGGSALGQINNYIINNDISNSDGIEKELLNSDEFWSKKLNSGNWVPEMNFENSQTNSRKRTYSEMTSSANDSDNNIDKNKNIVDDDDDDGDDNLHRKKKRKKNKEFLGESKNELPTENMTKNEKKNSKVEKKLKNEKSPHKTDSKRENEEIGTDDPDFGTFTGNHFDSERMSFEDLLVSPGKKGRKSSETKKEKISELERLSLDSSEREKIRLSSGKKKKIKKENMENSSDLEARQKSSVNKDDEKSNRPIDKQSESDSGVGLEGLKSPILFKPSSSTKQKSEEKSGRKGCRYSEEEFGSSEEFKSDASVLQMELLKDAIKSCQWKERSRVSEKEKTLRKISDSSEKKTPRSNKAKKTDRHSNSTFDRVSSPKPKSKIIEKNDESEDLRRSLSRQMMQDLKMEVDEEKETPCRSHKKKKKKDSSVKRELLGMFEEEKTGKEVGKKKESEPDRSDRGETTRDDSYEKLLARLSCEQRLSLGVKEKKERNDDDFSTKTKRKKKKDEEKEEKKSKKRTRESDREEAKEQTDGVDDNFSSLYSKLLQDALCSINGTDEEEELNSSYLKRKKDGLSKKMEKESCESESSSGKIKTKEEKKHKKKKSLKDVNLNLSTMSHEPAVTDSRKKEKKKKKDKTDKIEADAFRY